MHELDAPTRLRCSAQCASDGDDDASGQAPRRLDPIFWPAQTVLMHSFLHLQRQLARSHAKPLSPLARYYSAAPPTKASVKLIAEIRKAVPGTSLVKAREALEATTNDLPAALAWLEKDIAVSGAAKAAKLDGRTTGEGIIAVAILSPGGFGGPKGRGVRAAMIELNCETDFVARNGLFVKLAEDISHTAAFLAEPRAGDLIQTMASPEELADAPLILAALASATSSPSVSISDSIRSSIARLGEKISLRRVCTVVADPLRDPVYGLQVASHIHHGRVGALVGLGVHSDRLSTLGPSDEESLSKIGKALAIQVAGFNPETIKGTGSHVANLDSMALYDQPVMMMPQEAGDLSVGGFLKKWAVERGVRLNDGGEKEGLEVVQFERWSVGA